MSGGYFDYQQYRIDNIAEMVEELIDTNDSDEVDEYGYERGRGYNSDTIEEFRKGLRALRIAAIYAQRIDWLVSCDDGEESFHQRLKEELEKLGP